MNSFTTKITQHNSQTGFSLIELMVAMVIGLIILLGLVSLFTSSSALNRAQSGLSVLQENGRYAITRLKQDIENTGHKHCASLTLPNALFTNWDQGYEMKPMFVDVNVNLAATSSPSTNGLPLIGNISLDTLADPDQLGDTPYLAGLPSYPIDPSYFLQGHECTGAVCDPVLSNLGADQATNFRSPGVADGSRVPNTDILTMRYFDGGTLVDNIVGSVANTAVPIPAGQSGYAMISDCNLSIVVQAAWNANSITAAVPLADFSVKSKTSVYSMDQDFKTVSYFLGVDDDPNIPGRVQSSLYRSENGVAQQLVEGVERFDVFYLAQLQTGHVARLTAAEVQAVQDGGDSDSNNSIDNIVGCSLPPSIKEVPQFQMANNSGCLWRSIYAIEVNLLLNTVVNSSQVGDDRFIYSPDGNAPQDPSTGLVTGLPAEKMYRREFSAIVPIRNYTL